MHRRCWIALVLFATRAAYAQPKMKARERARQRMEDLRERKTLLVDGVERAYTVMQPLQREAAIPIVLVFGNMAQRPAVRNELAVYPEQWTSNDTPFVRQLIEKLLKGDKALDRTRVYAVGIGAGGSFVQSLGCSLHEQIAAIASIGGTLPGGLEADCLKATEAMPAMFVGGTGAAFWRKHNGCNAEGKNCRDGSEVAHTEAKGTRQASDVMEFVTRFRRTPR